MRITGLKTDLVNADRTTTAERPRGRNWLFLRLETDAGIVGLGEGGGWPEVVQAGLHEVAHFLIGENPFDIERLHLKIIQVLHPHGLTGAVRGGVLSAIDMALWDIKGKALGVPVYELLGGKVWDRIPVYGHASTPEQAKALVDRGYRAFKCGANAETVRTLRETVGPDIEIGVHCHGQFTPAAAIALGRACEPYAPAFFEEPTHPEDFDALAEVKAKVDIPLASGERLYNVYLFRDLIQRRLVQLVQPEITRVGGILASKRVATLAEAHQIKVAPHDGSAGPVAEMANLHLLASIPNPRFLEHRAEDVPWRSTVVRGVIPDRDGHLEVPDAPGLGLELDEDECNRHPAKQTGEYTYRIAGPDLMWRDHSRPLDRS